MSGVLNTVVSRSPRETLAPLLNREHAVGIEFFDGKDGRPTFGRNSRVML